MNPYNQWQQQGSGTPSIFGALPSPTSSSASTPHDAATFTLTNFKTTVLNSTVYDPSRREAYRVVTEASSPACTVVQNSQGRNIAMIKW
ncbi:uncharacterized protein BXZ73DRAFT_24850, partial [Epithele typhae]|uniref:uncharacterized protein n=1 Tax=Epithele typhae TaxID=378194 RepID=UPI00200728F7